MNAQRETRTSSQILDFELLYLDLCYYPYKFSTFYSALGKLLILEKQQVGVLRNLLIAKSELA